jgi:hypothetical protein
MMVECRPNFGKALNWQLYSIYKSIRKSSLMIGRFYKAEKKDCKIPYEIVNIDLLLVEKLACYNVLSKYIRNFVVNPYIFS